MTIPLSGTNDQSAFALKSYGGTSDGKKKPHRRKDAEVFYVGEVCLPEVDPPLAEEPPEFKRNHPGVSFP